MERQFLELLNFNINVPSSVYAKYYFDLRSLANASQLVFPVEQLSRERAVKLEVSASVVNKLTAVVAHAYVMCPSPLTPLFFRWVCLVFVYRLQWLMVLVVLLSKLVINPIEHNLF